jgi:hypothetical protein
MRISSLAAVTIFALALAAAPHAWAFTAAVDSDTNADGSSKYADPDEQFDDMANGSASAPFYGAETPVIRGASGRSNPVAASRSEPWTHERERLVFGPFNGDVYRLGQ